MMPLLVEIGQLRNTWDSNMAYTLATSVTQVRSLLNEDSASFWSDTEIENWIKEATIDIASKLLSAESEDDITLIASQWIYTSSDEAWLEFLLKSKAAYYDGGSNAIKGMQRIDMQKMGHTDVNTAGVPRYFFENNRAFYIWPPPAAAQANKTITVINAYETDDVTDLRDEHQPLTFLYAAARAKAKDRMFQESALYMAQYLNTINFERKDKYDMGVDPTTTFNVQ